MLEQLKAMLASIGESTLSVLPVLAIGAVAFTIIGAVVRSKASKGPWWRKPDLVTDLLYCFLLPSITSYARIAFLIVGAAAITGVLGAGDAKSWLEGGHGVFAGWPFWAQVVAYLLLGDVMLYWTHRIFHGRDLWRYHAIHHSSEHLDWLSAHRFHPVNLIFHSVLVDAILLLAGIAPEVILFVAPFHIFTAWLVHADLDWDFGPFRYVLASPVFHRWHHTGVDEGGEKNFAPTFPFIDLAFGTFYMPAGKLPHHFGVDDPHFPKSFEGQMLYPFQRPKKGESVEASG